MGASELPDWCIAHDKPWGHPTVTDAIRDRTGDVPKDGYYCKLGMRPLRLLGPGERIEYWIGETGEFLSRRRDKGS